MKWFISICVAVTMIAVFYPSCGHAEQNLLVSVAEEKNEISGVKIFANEHCIRLMIPRTTISVVLKSQLVPVAPFMELKSPPPDSSC
jgi:hypothetical protein